MKIFLKAIILILLSFPIYLFSQYNNLELPTSINEDGSPPDPSAIVDIQSSNKGLLIPRMPFCEIELIENPAQGLMIFDTEFNCLRIYIQDSWQCLYEKRGPMGTDFAITGWSNNPIDEGWDTDIDIDIEENVYVTTSTEDSEARLIKYDSKGNELWQIFEGGNAQMLDVEVDQNDFAFVLGAGSNTFNGISIPPTNWYLSKTSPDGNNSQLIGLTDIQYYAVMKIDNQDNLVIAAINDTSLPDIKELVVTKYSNTMNQLWIKKIDLISNSLYKSYSQLNIDIDEQDDIYITGFHQLGFLSPNPNNDPIDAQNIFVSKFASSDGAPIWYRNIASDISIRVDDIHVNDNLVEVFGSTDLDINGIIGSNYYIRRFRKNNGGTSTSANFPASWYVRGTSINEAKDEIVLMISDSAFPPSSGQVLFYSPVTQDFTDSKTISFTGGPVVFNADGEKVYGAGIGFQAGNTSISHNDSGEYTIVYKIQKD